MFLTAVLDVMENVEEIRLDANSPGFSAVLRRHGNKDYLTFIQTGMVYTDKRNHPDTHPILLESTCFFSSRPTPSQAKPAPAPKPSGKNVGGPRVGAGGAQRRGSEANYAQGPTGWPASSAC